MEIQPYRSNSRWFQHEDGSCFILQRICGTSIYLKCGVNKCPVRWTLKVGQAASPVRGQHNHEPVPWIKNRNLMYQSLKRRSISDTVFSLSAIYEQDARRFPDAAPHLPFDSVKSSMSKWRRRKPPAPHPVTYTSLLDISNDMKAKRKSDKKAASLDQNNKNPDVIQSNEDSNKSNNTVLEEHIENMSDDDDDEEKEENNCVDYPLEDNNPYEEHLEQSDQEHEVEPITNDDDIENNCAKNPLEDVDSHEVYLEQTDEEHEMESCNDDDGTENDSVHDLSEKKLITVEHIELPNEVHKISPSVSEIKHVPIYICTKEGTVKAHLNDVNINLKNGLSTKVTSVAEENDNLDHFTAYLGSLLRKVPKNLTNKLQLDIIQLVLNVLLDDDAKAEKEVHRINTINKDDTNTAVAAESHRKNENNPGIIKYKMNKIDRNKDTNIQKNKPETGQTINLNVIKTKKINHRPNVRIGKKNKDITTKLKRNDAIIDIIHEEPRQCVIFLSKDVARDPENEKKLRRRPTYRREEELRIEEKKEDLRIEEKKTYV